MTPARRVLRAEMSKLGKQSLTWFGNRDPLSLRVLEVGIAGDEPPGANREFFHSPSYFTADKDVNLKPDFVIDLVDPKTYHDPLIRGVSDIVICSQVLEHIWELEEAASALWQLTAIDGRCVVDVPFCYPAHIGFEGDPNPDYWRLTPQGLERLLRRAGFGKVDVWVDPAWLITGAVAIKSLTLGIEEPTLTEKRSHDA